MLIGGAKQYTFTDYEKIKTDCEGFSLVKNTSTRGNYLLIKNGVPHTISRIDRDTTSVTIENKLEEGWIFLDGK